MYECSSQTDSTVGVNPSIEMENLILFLLMALNIKTVQCQRCVWKNTCSTTWGFTQCNPKFKAELSIYFYLIWKLFCRLNNNNNYNLYSDEGKKNRKNTHNSNKLYRKYLMVRFIPHKGQNSTCNRMLRCCWDEHGSQLNASKNKHSHLFCSYFFSSCFDSKLKRDQLLFTQCQFTKYFIISVFISTIKTPANWMLKFSISLGDVFFRKSPLPVIILCRWRYLQREGIDFCEKSPGGIHGANPSNSLIFKMRVYERKSTKTVFICWRIAKNNGFFLFNWTVEKFH